MPISAKNDKNYRKVEIDTKAISRAYEKRKKASKFPTSVCLPEEVVAELKAIAHQKCVPYQTLMRMLIIEGLEKLRKIA
jgi:hypothetical protein